MFDNYYDVYSNMRIAKDFVLSKPYRNVPQYMRKKEQGRNEKCACCIGKKYKNCCGKKEV